MAGSARSSSRDKTEKKNGSRAVIVVTGTPGTGKTTFAKDLSGRMRAETIQLSSLIMRDNMVHGKDPSRDTLIVDEERVRSAVSRILKGLDGYVVVEGHQISGMIPKKIQSAFVLRCNPHELGERLRRRGYKAAKIRENVEAEILDVCLIEAVNWFGEKSVYEIDTTGKPASQAVDEAWGILFEGRTGMLGHIDWLSYLEREGTLSSFLEGEEKRTKRST